PSPRSPTIVCSRAARSGRSLFLRLLGFVMTPICIRAPDLCKMRTRGAIEQAGGKTGEMNPDRTRNAKRATRSGCRMGKSGCASMTSRWQLLLALSACAAPARPAPAAPIEARVGREGTPPALRDDAAEVVRARARLARLGPV